MSFWKQIEIIDPLGDIADVTHNGEQVTVSPVRLSGGPFSGTAVEPLFLSVVVTGSGSVSVSGGIGTLSTGATANSSITGNSVEIARYIGSEENVFVARLALGDTGTVNNVRRWGAFNGTNGAYFKISGTTVSVCTMNGGAETAIASSSWNISTTVPTLTNFNRYWIDYSQQFVTFFINGLPVHQATFLTGVWSSTPHLPIQIDNTNSGGSTTNVTMEVSSSAIYRLGDLYTQPKAFHGTGAATSTIKFSPALLRKVVVNSPVSTGSSSMTIYDNTAASGTVIAVLSFNAGSQPVSIPYDVALNVGLTIVTTGSGWDYTVVFE